MPAKWRVSISSTQPTCGRCEEISIGLVGKQREKNKLTKRKKGKNINEKTVRKNID